MADHYRKREITYVVDNGPADDEDWYRVQFSGKTSSRTLNLSEEEMKAIADLLYKNDNPTP